MIEVTAQVDVARPAAEVFDYLSNFENNPRWQRGMRAARFTTAPPLRVGSTYEQEAIFLGKRITSRFAVVALDPGRAVTIDTIAGSFPITVIRRVEPLGPQRSRVSALVRGNARGFYRIAQPLLRWMVQRSVRADYRRLRQLLQAEGVSTGWRNRPSEP